MRKAACKGTHKGHLCVLASEERLEDIRELVREPKFICFNCGRVAHSRKNLCNPMALGKKA